VNESVRSLLDEAVADVRPRDADPVTRVMRRARKARLRHFAAAGAAGVVAVVLIATGGIIAGNRTGAQITPAAPSTPSGKDFRPPLLDVQIEGGIVRTGGLAVSTPKGWRQLRDRTIDHCKIPQNSVLINVMEIPGGECDLHAQMSLSSWQPTTYPAAVSSLGTVSEVILPGGQPLWLDPNELNNVRVSAHRGFAGVTLAMPWAGARVVVDAPPAQTSAILGGISSVPVVAARLTLPDESSAVQLNVEGEDQAASTDKTAIAHVLELLRGLDQPVQNGELPCAGAEGLTPTWKLAGTDMAGLNFISSRPTAKSSATPSVTGMVAISTTDGCAFATSSLGGRVHLPAGILAQIQHLLGSR
jgi:hypothetical protein